MRQSLCAAYLLLAASAVFAADSSTEAAIDTKAAFAFLKSLSGEWQANSKMGKSTISYEVIAGGTALVERESGEKMPVMLTVYHMDGNRLILTHYCMAGNQPRMQARAFDPKAGVLKFEFLDATNLSNPDVGHMRNATLRLMDNEHFTADWEFYEGGKRKNTESFQYSRVR